MKKLLTIILTIALLAITTSCGTMKVVQGSGSGLVTIDNKMAKIDYSNVTYYVNYTLEQVVEELHLRPYGHDGIRDEEWNAKLMLVNPNSGEYYHFRVAVMDFGLLKRVAYYDGEFHCKVYTLDEDYLIEKAKAEGRL